MLHFFVVSLRLIITPNGTSIFSIMAPIDALSQKPFPFQVASAKILFQDTRITPYHRANRQYYTQFYKHFQYALRKSALPLHQLIKFEVILHIPNIFNIVRSQVQYNI